MRLIGCGGMLTESFVAVMALISAAILDQHLYFTLNAPVSRTGGTAATAANYVNHLGLSGPAATPRQLTDEAAGAREKSVVSRTVVTVVVIKKGYPAWAWMPGSPLLWDLTVTLTASWQKIFSSDQGVGYWTQHYQYAAPQGSGQDVLRLGENACATWRRHQEHLCAGHAVRPLRRAC